MISIHAPTRGATSVFRCMTSSNGYFNPRSHEGSDSPLSVAWLLLVNFNPRSHEGSDEDAAKAAEKLKISIHAPTRGATTRALIPHSPIINFNPRSHEGSDWNHAEGRSSHGRFQSTLPRGERRHTPCSSSCHSSISIHAPTRGATMSPEGSDYSYAISIHAPTRGATSFCSVPPEIAFLFQSTLPRGERQQFSPKSSLFSQQKLSKIFNLNNKLF